MCPHDLDAYTLRAAIDEHLPTYVEPVPGAPTPDAPVSHEERVRLAGEEIARRREDHFASSVYTAAREKLGAADAEPLIDAIERVVRERDEARAVKGEAVNHPAHYGGADNPYETIRVLLAWYGVEATALFCELNAVKYLSRAGKKGAYGEDLRKAAWYSERAARLRETGGL